MDSLAPIVLFVYNRLDHTKQTIEALQKNELAEESELFIYSDAAKNEDAMKQVNEVREYIKSIDGFKTVIVIEREKNWGLANSIIDGVTNIINQYGKIIVLEDDLITSPHFLEFMNDTLRFYKTEKGVFAISGYSNISIPPEYKHNMYFAHISTSWGWATWSDRWKSIDWDNKCYLKLLENRKLLKEIEKKVGNSRIKMLQIQMKGKIDSWAVRRLFSQLIQNKMTLFPSKTLVQNIGHDGSGIHCGNNSDFDKDNKLSKTNLFEELPFREDRLINKLIYKKNHTTVISKIKNRVKRLFK